MGNKITNKQAKEGLEAIGMWMDARYNSRFVGTPIQTWDIPRKEKNFFTVYAMHLMVESDGLESLTQQKKKDVAAFIRLLRSLGAKKTATLVRAKLTTLRKKDSGEKYKCTTNYYNLFEREKVWLKLLHYIGRRIYVSYVLRAQAIEESGGNIFDPKQWQGKLPKV